MTRFWHLALFSETEKHFTYSLKQIFNIMKQIYYATAMQHLNKRGMVFDATFNSISVIKWGSVLLVEKTEVPGENHQPVTTNFIT
jgi:hypothetical protein